MARRPLWRGEALPSPPDCLGSPPFGRSDHEYLWCQARDDAKAAAGRFESSDLPRAVLTVLHNLRTERTELQKRYEERLHAEWKIAWETSPQGRHIAQVDVVDNTPPGPAVLELYRGLSRQQCSILSQLRSGHVGLNAFLARIHAIDSPLCLACSIPETVSHFLFTCRRFTAARHTFRKAVKGQTTLRNTIGNVKTQMAVLDFVGATGRLEAYRTPSR